MRTEEEKILRRIPLETAGLALLSAVVGLFLFSPVSGLFVMAGGLFSAWNFLWLRRALTRFLSLDKRRAVRAGISLYLARLILIIAVFFIIILLFPRMILAFAAGFSTIILAFLAEAAAAYGEIKKWKG